MNRWRWWVIISLIVSIAILIAVALLFEGAWSWYPWRMPVGVRGRLHGLWRGTTWGILAAMTAGLAARFMIGSALLYLLPRSVGRMAQALKDGRSIGRYALLGLLVLLGAVSFMALAAFSAETFPMAIFLLFGTLITASFGATALLYRLGRDLLRKANWVQGSPLVALGLGLLIAYALSNIPFLGIVIFILIEAIGAGVAFGTRFGSGRVWSLSPLSEESEA